MCAQRWCRVERIGGLISGALPARVQRHMAGWLAVDVWPRVVGQEAARRSAAIAFRDGRLTVEVVNSAWLHRLTSSSHRYLQRINQEVDGVEVNEIVYRVNPGLTPAGDEGRPGAASAAGPAGPECAVQSGATRRTDDGATPEAEDGATPEADDGATPEADDEATRKTDADDESVQRQRGRRGLSDEELAGG